MSSPIKNESSPYNSQYQQHVFQKPASPATKTIAKLIKTEEVVTSLSPNVPSPSVQSVKPQPNEYESDFNDAISMVGIDLVAEKKLLSASNSTTTSKMTNLDQIKCKDEKFLNNLILHKKFLESGKSSEYSSSQKAYKGFN